MKMPNGYGSVYKLSGNRRKPWAARVTDGWVNNPKTKKSKQVYKFVGFYETRKEALKALADYNTNPFNIDTANITFQEVYERWSSEHFPTVSDSNVKGYKAAFLLCAPIAGRRFVDVKLDDLQAVADNSGKNYPTLRKYKVLVGLMYKYAVIHEIIPKERNVVEYINIKKAGNPNAYNREPFSKEEVARIWEVKDSNIYYTVVLMLIYTGCRISELLDFSYVLLTGKNSYFFMLPERVPGNKRKPRKYRISGVFLSSAIFGLNYLLLNCGARRAALRPY